MDESYFAKPLLLPSNGFEYEKICFIKPPTLEFILFNEDKFFQDSDLERQISFVRKYTSINPLILYTFDFYYILANFYFYLHEGEEYKKPTVCLSCNAVRRLKIDLKKLPAINILASDAQRNLEFSVSDIKINYRRRKVVDNIEFSQKTMDEKKYPTLESKVIAFLSPQINSITFKDKEYTDQNAFAQILINAKKKTLNEIYSKFTEKDFGLDDRVMYKCPSCKFDNYTCLYEDIEMSTYYPSEFTEKGAKDYFKNLINANRLRFIGYNDYKEIPLHYFPLINKVMEETDLHHLGAR